MVELQEREVVERGILTSIKSAYIRSGDGREFVAEAFRDGIAAAGASTAYIGPKRYFSIKS